MNLAGRGLLLTQLNALCAALAFVTGRLVLQGEAASAWQFGALNYMVAVAANTLWYGLTRARIVPTLHAPLDDREQASRRITLRGWGWLLAHTAASAAGFACQWRSFDFIAAHVGAVISRVEAVVGVLLGLWLLGEAFSRRQWVGVALAAAGVVLIQATTLRGEPAGFAWALGGALGFGLAEVTGKLAVKYVAVPRLVLIRAWIMCALLTALWLALDPGLPELTPALWGWLVVSALCGPVIGRNAYMLALSYLPVSQVVMLNQTNPVYAALAAYLLLGEVPAARTLIGGALIVGGVLFLLKRRQEPVSAVPPRSEPKT